MKAEEEVENEKVLKIIHGIDQMNIGDEILKDYDSDDDIYVLEPVPEPENSEPKSKKPKVQQKMTKYFSVNSGK